MGYQTQLALVAIHKALQEHNTEINQQGARLDRLEKIVEAQAQEIANLERSVTEMRNRSIRAAVDRGVPTKIVAQAHGLSSGRISQIAPRRRPPLC